MRIPELVELVEGADVFKVWKGQHAQAFLAHAFSMGGMLQLGYYDPEAEKATSFFWENESVVCSEAMEVLKDPASHVQPLRVELVMLTPQDAMDHALQFQKKEYAGEVVFKSFFVLQTLDVGQVFNITFVTHSMKTINIKLSSDTGEIVQHHIDSLMNFGEAQ
ncbi:hypothetical protein J4457_04735 [Candidatus Woesearchaeota archaeon]|nr:hypothetical protein [Candidatus Woesearchaeota archaeon]